MTVGRSAETSASALLPLHLSLAKRKVVVVGGGPVGTRKVAGALAAGALVTVIAPEATAALKAAARQGRINWLRRSFARGDLRAAWLVFTATGVLHVDEFVAAQAESLRVFCVRSDDGTSGTARSAAVLRRDGVLIGVSGENEPDPGRVVELRDAIGAAIDTGALGVPPRRRQRPAHPDEQQSGRVGQKQ